MTVCAGVVPGGSVRADLFMVADRVGLLLGFALLASSSLAQAGTLPFTAEFGMTIALLPEVVVTGSGVAQINGSGPLGHIVQVGLPGGEVGTTRRTIEITDTAAYPLRGVQFTLANGAGNFAPTGMGRLGGIMPIFGVSKVCLFGDCDSAIANLVVPLSVVGMGGLAAADGVVNVTVQGAPWTTGTVFVGFPSIGATAMGFAHGPASGTSSTGLPGGTLQLVTPILLITDLGADNLIPATARFTLHFLPEPTTLVLLGSGIVVLAARGLVQRRC